MKNNFNSSKSNGDWSKEAGSSLVIALMVLMLLLGFVALALSRTASEAQISMNDSSETNSFNAAQAQLESVSRDFATVSEAQISPSSQDTDNIAKSVIAGFDGYKFDTKVEKISDAVPVTLSSGSFQGLYSLRDQWQTDVTATEKSSGVQVQLRRRFNNDRIPVFQFTSFSSGDLEIVRPGEIYYTGRIHANGNFYVTAGTSGAIHFGSKVTIGGEIINEVWRNNSGLQPGDVDNVWIPNASGVEQMLNTGSASVRCVTTAGSTVLVDVTGRNYPYSSCVKNPNWATYSAKFDGNLQANAPKLKLPLSNPIEMIRRGKLVGDKGNIGGNIVDITTANKDTVNDSNNRLANKDGIRISLADSSDKLPQCVAKITCGIRLDANLGSSLGYQPTAMTDGYKATAVNGNRLASPTINNSTRQVWIKVELVASNSATGIPTVTDVTEDFLSLGVTEQALINGVNVISGYTTTTDSRSIIKLQRFLMPGSYPVVNPTATTYMTNANISSVYYNFVAKNTVPAALTFNLANPLLPQCSTPCPTKDAFAASVGSNGVASDETQHLKLATINSNRYFVVPFPIEMFDTREGDRTNLTTSLTNGYIFRNGVMSLVDLDISNLRRFLNGEFDGLFPTTTAYAVSKGNVGLKSSDVPSQKGWVIYFSDRRGDYNFDGQYNMEDTNPLGTKMSMDLNNNGVIDTDYVNEAPPQSSTAESAYSAVTDHSYYRRGLRLINGMYLPGKYDSMNPANTQGLTIASENGVYVKGNYNVQSVSLGTIGTLSSGYTPLDTTQHVPAAIIADAYTLLSANWKDGNSFAYPLDPTKRVPVDIQLRFALIAGTGLTEKLATQQVGSSVGFKGGSTRLLEDWRTVIRRINYAGSVVNMFPSYNNNGQYKCCVSVMKAPLSDSTFDTSLTDIDRLPPATPFAYYMSFTGFERIKD